MMEWLITLIGSVTSIVTSIAVLAYWLGSKFKEIDMRFGQIDERFKQIDEKFEQIDERFRRIDERFGQIDERFRQIDERFQSIDKRFAEVENELGSLGNEVRSLRNMILRLTEAFKSSQEFMIDFLAYEGVLRREAADVLKREVGRVLRIVSTQPNPLTREEVERLKQLIEKDELTLEEAEELYEIANKLVYEYGTSETWKLLLYARFWIGYNLRKMREQREKEEGRG